MSMSKPIEIHFSQEAPLIETKLTIETNPRTKRSRLSRIFLSVLVAAILFSAVGVFIWTNCEACSGLFADNLGNGTIRGETTESTYSGITREPNPEERGLYPLFEGDIAGYSSDTRMGAGLTNVSYKWPSATLIYEIDPAFEHYQSLWEAMSHIVGKTCIRFKLRNKEEDYINIIHGTGCNSYVGRRGGKQELSLGKECNHFGTVLHELVHAMGFFHEQSRTDRDDYITILWENIHLQNHNNFKKYDAGYISAYAVPYDTNSIMHYSQNAWGIDGIETIRVKNPTARIGNRDYLSSFDVQKINNMYCQGVRTVRILSGYNNAILTLWKGVIQNFQKIHTYPDINADYQDWTLDWYGLTNSPNGSKIWSWVQGGDTLKVIDEDLKSYKVQIMEDFDAPNQKWIVLPIGTTIFGLLQNVGSGRCLVHNGIDQAYTAACESSNVKQRWEMLDSSNVPPQKTLTRNPCGVKVNYPYEFPFPYECVTHKGTRLTFGTDGNMIISDPRYEWSTGTHLLGGRYARFRTDGNFVILDGQENIVWSSNTSGKGNTIVIQEDGNVVIYDKKGVPRWDTFHNSNAKCLIRKCE